MPDIINVNGDNTLANSSTGNIATGTDLQDVNTITVTDANGNTLNGTNLAPSATQVTFDYGDMIANNIKFGSAMLEALEVLADFRITQAGDFRITQSGDSRITN